MGGKWLNLVHMHEVNEDLTIAGLQITNTKENQRLGREGLQETKGQRLFQWHYTVSAGGFFSVYPKQ